MNNGFPWISFPSVSFPQTSDYSSIFFPLDLAFSLRKQKFLAAIGRGLHCPDTSMKSFLYSNWTTFHLIQRSWENYNSSPF